MRRLILLFFLVFFSLWAFGNEAHKELCDIKYSVSGQGKPGRYVLTPLSMKNRNGKIPFMIVNHHGECVYFHRPDVWASDLKPHILSGELYFSYAEIKQTFSGLSGHGARVILDKNMNEIKKVHYKVSTMVSPFEIDLHEFVMLDLNHYLFYYMNPEFDYLGRCLIHNNLVELKDGELISQWSSKSIPLRDLEIPDFQYKYNQFLCVDYFHINSIQKTSSPSGYILSAARQNAVYFISPQSPTPSWTLGGKADQFSLTEDQKFSFQHTATYDPQTQHLLLFDNGIHRKGARVLEFALDFTHRRISRWYTHLSLPKETTLMGSVFSCGPDCLVINPGPDQDFQLIEYDTQKNRTIFQLRFTDPETFLYRAYKIAPQ